MTKRPFGQNGIKSIINKSRNILYKAFKKTYFKMISCVEKSSLKYDHSAVILIKIVQTWKFSKELW